MDQVKVLNVSNTPALLTNCPIDLVQEKPITNAKTKGN